MQAHAHPWTVASSPRVVVARAGWWRTVDLRQLYATERDGSQLVSLADVWVASGLRGDLFALSFDFLDEEGRSASRGGGAKLSSETFAKGWLDVETRAVSWDEGELVPSHWHIKGVRTIVAANAVPRRDPRAKRRW
jgi:hypothetical protein